MRLNIRLDNREMDELSVETEFHTFTWFRGDVIVEQGKIPHWNLDQSGGWIALFESVMKKVWDILEKEAEKI